MFLLAEEVLSSNISKLVLKGEIKPIFSTAGCPPVCHLKVADDILLFFRAIPNNAAKLSRLLSLYRDSSGQKFNLNKCLLFFGNAVLDHARQSAPFFLSLSPNLLPNTWELHSSMAVLAKPILTTSLQS